MNLPEMTAEQIILGLASLGWVAKGVLEKQVFGKRVERGCLYGDDAHAELTETLNCMDREAKHHYIKADGRLDEIRDSNVSILAEVRAPRKG